MPATSDIQGRRSAGILLHPVSLPGPFGIGDLGPSAWDWVRSLRRARMAWWQVLPLGPTGYADSPYQSFSSFAGNTNLISPELLAADGLLDTSDIAQLYAPGGPIRYDVVISQKRAMVQRAWNRFPTHALPEIRNEFESFCHDQASWLEDFVLFMALKDAHGGRPWSEWSVDYAFREPLALRKAQENLREEMATHRFGQFLFFRQWNALRSHARANHLRLIGDLPIFVAFDSADVWTDPHLFRLDAERRPISVAGVPPDYFATTGQLWGNPLYDWDAMASSGFAWWIARLRAALQLVDVVRMDHFRGVQAFWEVPAPAKTAEGGRWVVGPGARLLTALKSALGELPLIAEDLGFITPEVDALREQFALPGMRILQFAFGGAVESRFLPHNIRTNVVVYPGTHDNDTTVGWFHSLTVEERTCLLRYVPGADRDPAWSLLRLAWATVADCAIAPMQDVLRLGAEARMNRPGTCSGNWKWRFQPQQFTPQLIDDLAELTETYGRTLDKSPN